MIKTFQCNIMPRLGDQWWDVPHLAAKKVHVVGIVAITSRHQFRVLISEFMFLMFMLLPSKGWIFSCHVLMCPSREPMPRRDNSWTDSEAARFHLMCFQCQGASHGVSWQLWEWSVLRCPPEQKAEICLPVWGRLLLHRRAREACGMWLCKMFISLFLPLYRLRCALKKQDLLNF